MPITKVNPAEVSGIFRFGVPDLPVDDVTPDWMQSMGASFERENILSSTIAYNRGRPGALTKEEHTTWMEGGFNPVEQVTGSQWDNPTFLPYVSRARSQRELDHMLKNFEREGRNDELLARATTTQAFVSAMTAGMLDPVLAPTLAVPAIRGSLAARISGTATTGASLAGLSEVGLHTTQPKRTLSESAMNMGASAMFGAMLGPMGKSMSEVEIKAAVAKIDDEFHGVPTFMGDSVGSARVEENLPEGFMNSINERLKEGEITEQEAAVLVRDEKLNYLALKNQPIMKIFAFASPVLRVATSGSPKARALVENMTEDSFIRTKNEYGHTSGFSVETVSKGQVNSALAHQHDILNEEYAKYVGSTSRVGQTVNRVKDKDIMSFDEFAEEVGRSQPRGDVHSVPEVQGAAKRIRSDIDSPIEEALLAEKMIPADEAGKAKVPMGDKAHYARVYNFDKISNDRLGFKRMMIDSIRRKIKDPKELEEFNDPFFQRKLNSHLNETVSHIIGSPTGYFDKNVVPETGFLKKRKINLSSEDLQDWLVTDVRVVKEAYLRNIVPQLELTKRFGSIDLEDQLAAIDAEYAVMAEQMAPNSRQVKKLNAEAERVKRDIMGMRDIILNRYKRPEDPSSVFHKAGHLIRAHNYVTSLGGMTVASITDIGAVIARVGLKPFAKGITQLALHPKRFNIARKQARRMAAGLDVTLNTRAQSLMMMDDSITSQHKFDAMVDKGVRAFSKVTGMAYWNAGLKQFAGTMYMDDMGRLIHKKTLTKKEITHLAAAGIDTDTWRVLQSQWKKHGTHDSGLHSPNIDDWTDKNAAQTLSSAVLKEVDTAVVTPGAGDLPLVSRSDVGKMIFQFKSFAFASQNRILLANVQRLGLDQTMGFISMMALGSASYGMKEWAAGREPSSDWNTIAREMVDKSGYFGYLSDINSITEKVTRGAVGLQAVMGGEPISRYRSKSVVGDLLGPTAGKASDYATAIGTGTAALTGGEISESDIKAVRRLIPYQNLIYIRRILNQLEEAAAGAAQ